MFLRTKVVAHIPNFITILNLISGAIGVFFVFQEQVLWASMMIYLAAIFDFLDGFAARLLKATSEIGKSLDSLADVISFGLLPSAILYHIIKGIVYQINPAFSMAGPSITEILVLASPLLIVAFSALRLAKFNVDTRQNYGFIGVPTPATAMLISSFPFIIKHEGSIGALLLAKLYILVPLILVLSLLMVSEMPIIALKFTSYGFSKNLYIYLLVIISAIGIICWGISFIPAIFALYILFSLIKYRVEKK